MEEWRIVLYPLGFASGLAFALRFIIQWFQSEKAKKSVVPPLFWKISLLGNALLILHSFIQIQYHVCLIQGLNAIISWRNLNLIQQKTAPVRLSTVIVLFVSTFLTISFAFALQDFLIHQSIGWFRIPQAPWQSNPAATISPLWHLLGFIGYILFSGRFWVQWWMAEKAKKSELPPIFWQLSLSGALLSIVYFYQIGDLVNLIGPVIGLVPYLRNLMLLKKSAMVCEKS